MTSTTIYTLPYVYRLDNILTNEFYIGYRSANKVPSHQDLGFKYFTSSKIVKSRFEEFNITIIAEFFNPQDAYDHEQYLIHCELGNSLMLNIRCFHGSNIRFNTLGKKHSDETKTKISITSTNISDETRAKISTTSKGRIVSQETRNKISNRTKGLLKSDETKERMRKPKSEDHKSNISEALKDKPKSKKHRDSLSVSKTGIKLGPRSDETTSKIINTMLEKYGVSNPSQILFLSIISTKKAYSKGTLSRCYPEFKQYY